MTEFEELSDSSAQMSRNSHNYRRLSDTDMTNLSGDGHFALVRIRFRDLISVTVALPFFTFIFNIFYVLNADFDRATNINCRGIAVKNILPSFSAIVGDFTLARCIWTIAIALHAAPRFLFVHMTYRYLETVIYQKYRPWAQTVFILGVVENFGLVGLTYVSSKANLSVHIWCFISFLLCSEFYMLICCTLLSKYRNIPPKYSREIQSLQLKWKLFLVNFTFAILSALAYIRHNAYCEDGMYTFFALCEYIIVFSNMGFHFTAYLDFYERALVI